jgi:lipoprotein-anchoring transpeptidase ErfK/SrfK
LSASKIFLLLSVGLICIISTVGIVKKISSRPSAPPKIEKEQPIATLKPPAPVYVEPKPPAIPSEPIASNKVYATNAKEEDSEDFPNVDRVQQLFSTGTDKLPIVETINYTSRVSWLTGRPAWVADYASHYGTSRHFIARSLNGKPDYFNQTVATGSRFNVFKKEKNINFYLLIDLSRCKMAFYYVDVDSKERVLVKTYRVGLGCLDSQKASGSLTPTGTYLLGNKTAVYKPGTMGYFLDQKTEMMQVFGTRWIPFQKGIASCTEAAKGYGIHGAPWSKNPKSGELTEIRDCVGKYESDGGVRLYSEDLEELFAIIVTKPTFVVIVKDFKEAQLPGVEITSPRSS